RDRPGPTPRRPAPFDTPPRPNGNRSVAYTARSTNPRPTTRWNPGPGGGLESPEKDPLDRRAVGPAARERLPALPPSPASPGGSADLLPATASREEPSRAAC